MSSLLGRIDEYDSTKEDWSQYVEPVEHFFTVNKITDTNRKKPAFLAVIRPATYGFVRNLVSSTKSGEKLYDQLVKALKDHFNPTLSETVQHSCFNSHKIRKPGDSVATIVSELHSLAESCILVLHLRDRIVCGINNSKIWQKLLAEKNLTLTLGVKTAQGMEAAAKNDKEITQQESAQVSKSVPRLTPLTRGKGTSRNRSKFTGTCFCCDKVGHKRENCCPKDVTCRGCGKRGLIKRVCHR